MSVKMWINNILKREQLCCSKSNKPLVTGRENRNIRLLLLKYKKGVLVGDTRRRLNKYEFSFYFFHSLITDPSKRPSPSLRWHKLSPALHLWADLPFELLEKQSLLWPHKSTLSSHSCISESLHIHFCVCLKHTYMKWFTKPILQTALNLTHGCGLTSKIRRNLCVRSLSAGRRNRTDVGKYATDTRTERQAACKDQVLLRKGQPSFPSGSA